jgi:hypothetical protein
MSPSSGKENVFAAITWRVHWYLVAWSGYMMRRAVVPDCKAETLLPLLQQYVALGSIIFSDCWKGYCKISDLADGYWHSTVNHSKTYKAKDGTHTNTIESCWNGKFKKRIGNQYYADEQALKGIFGSRFGRIR